MSSEPSSPPPVVLPRADVAPFGDAAMPTRRGKRRGPWIALAVVAAVVALVLSTVRSGTGAFMYSKYVDEVLREPQRYAGLEIRVEGVVTAGSVRTVPGSGRYEFDLERQRRTMPVQFAGIVPDTFREGIGVTVRGRLAPDGVFHAAEVIAKCPSRYEMQAARARGETMGRAPAAPTP